MFWHQCVRPPTTSSPVDCFRNCCPQLHSEHKLELLHWQASHSLGGWLCLEDTRLLGEWVHTLACRSGWLLLQLHVQAACQLEATILLELGRSKIEEACHDCSNLLGFQLRASGKCVHDTTLAERTTGLHGLHCLHRRCHDC